MAIYAVWGPPQSGKTTLAIDIAYALSMHGQSVCLVSPERYSELSARMRIRIETDKSLAAVNILKESIKHIVYPADELLYVLAAPFESDAFGEDVSSDNARKLMEEAESIFDVVIVDCSAHCESSIAAWAMSMADTILLLSGGSPGAAIWYGAFHRAIDAVKDRLIPICVEVTDDFDYHSLFGLTGIQPETSVPFYPDAAIEQNGHKTLYGQGGKLGRKYTSGINDVCYLLGGGDDDE